MNLPNLISLLRLLSVPAIIWMVLEGLYSIAFLSFLLAGLSDALDGLIARGLKAHTRLGSYLDPLADKALLVSLFIVLGYKHLIPIWLVIGAVFRDLLIIGGICLFFILGIPFTVRPLLISKINTFLQVLLVGLLLAQYGLPMEGLEKIFTPLYYGVGISTVLSGICYLIVWYRRISEPKP